MLGGRTAAGPVKGLRAAGGGNAASSVLAAGGDQGEVAWGEAERATAGPSSMSSSLASAPGMGDFSFGHDADLSAMLEMFDPDSQLPYQIPGSAGLHRTHSAPSVRVPINSAENWFGVTQSTLGPSNSMSAATPLLQTSSEWELSAAFAAAEPKRTSFSGYLPLAPTDFVTEDNLFGAQRQLQRQPSFGTAPPGLPPAHNMLSGYPPYYNTTVRDSGFGQLDLGAAVKGERASLSADDLAESQQSLDSWSQKFPTFPKPLTSPVDTRQKRPWLDTTELSRRVQYSGSELEAALAGDVPGRSKMLQLDPMRSAITSPIHKSSAPSPLSLPPQSPNLAARGSIPTTSQPTPINRPPHSELQSPEAPSSSSITTSSQGLAHSRSSSFPNTLSMLEKSRKPTVIRDLSKDLAAAPGAIYKQTISGPTSPSGSDPAKMGSLSKPQSHSAAERRRRDRINERFNTLRLLVPNAAKADKASVLGEVIEYVRKLQVQTAMCSPTNSPSSPSNISSPRGNSPDSEPTSHQRLMGNQLSPFASPIDESASSREEIVVEGPDTSGHVIIKINCKDRIGLLHDITHALRELGLVIIRAEICSNERYVQDLFHVKPEGDASLSVHLIKSKLKVVIDADAEPPSKKRSLDS
eukprot:jgi/Chlat1/7418/Chrsp6S07439